MKWASAVSQAVELPAAVHQACSRIAEELGGTKPSAIFLFASPAYGRSLVELPRLVRSFFPRGELIGCVASGVIGDGLEVEGRPGLSVTAACMPDVKLTAMRVTPQRLPTPDDPPQAWMRMVGVPGEELPHFLLLADPAFSGMPDLLAGLDFAFPASVKAGGLASGGPFMGAHLLFLGEDVYTDGAVGLAFSGPVVMETVVAQGCRPIGEPRRITRCHQHLLMEMDGEPPLAYLRALYPRLPPRDRELVRTNLFLGIAMDFLLTPDEVGPGDFLIRNILGADPERGILAVGAHLREGQLVQFHVRDALSSAEDLERQLRSYSQRAGGLAAGALLFQCTGRGMHLYGRPNHDSSLFRRLVGPVPLGGFFCNGEIGPVRETTYLHGYTSCFAIFRER